MRTKNTTNTAKRFRKGDRVRLTKVAQRAAPPGYSGVAKVVEAPAAGRPAVALIEFIKSGKRWMTNLRDLEKVR